MKRIGSIVMALLLVLLCYAQEPRRGDGPPPPRGNGEQPPSPPSMEERLERVSEKICAPLALNKEQSEKVVAAYKTFYTEVDKARKASAQRGPLDKAVIEPIAKKRDDAVRNVITDKLFPKYKELERDMRPKREGPPPPQPR